MKRVLRVLLVLVLMLSGYAPWSKAQAVLPTEVAANPGRPTVSTPVTLTPVGYLQFENGTVYANRSGEFSTRVGINQVTKLAVARRRRWMTRTIRLTRLL